MNFISYVSTLIKYNKGIIKNTADIKKHWKVYKEWQAQLITKKKPIDLELPWTTIVSKNYMIDYLSPQSRNDLKVFEYGSGGSSLFFLKYALEVVTVEHDASWFQLVDKTIKNKKYTSWVGKLFLPKKNANANQKLDKSQPNDYFSEDFSDSNFKDYATFIDNYPDGYFDIVLVDGRARPSCMAHAATKIKKNGLLVVDNSERSYYYDHTKMFLKNYTLVLSEYSALICTNQLTQTNIFVKTF
jgi:hypothetical protein